MTRVSLLAFLLLLWQPSIQWDGGWSSSGRGTAPRTARAIDRAPREEPRLAASADLSTLLSGVVERRAMGHGWGATGSVWGLHAGTTSSNDRPAVAHDWARGGSRVPWPYHDAPYQATAPPDVVFAS